MRLYFSYHQWVGIVSWISRGVESHEILCWSLTRYEEAKSSKDLTWVGIVRYLLEVFTRLDFPKFIRAQWMTVVEFKIFPIKLCWKLPYLTQCQIKTSKDSFDQQKELSNRRNKVLVYNITLGGAIGKHQQNFWWISVSKTIFAEIVIEAGAEEAREYYNQQAEREDEKMQSSATY